MINVILLFYTVIKTIYLYRGGVGVLVDFNPFKIFCLPGPPRHSFFLSLYVVVVFLSLPLLREEKEKEKNTKTG